jgi:hypothetical protein
MGDAHRHGIAALKLTVAPASEVGRCIISSGDITRFLVPSHQAVFSCCSTYAAAFRPQA